MQGERLILWPMLGLLLLPPALVLYDWGFGAATGFETRLLVWNLPWHIAALIVILSGAFALRRADLRLPVVDLAGLLFLLGMSLWLSRTSAANPAQADLLLQRLGLAVALGVVAHAGASRMGAYFVQAVYGALLVGVVLTVPLLWLVIWQQYDNPAYFWPWLMPGFGAVRLYGYALEAGIAVGVGMLAVLPLPRIRQVLLWLVVILLWAMLFWSGARGGVLALGVGVALGALLLPKRALALLGVGALSAALGAGLSLLLWLPDLDGFGLWEMFVKSTNPDAYNQSGSRMIRWRAALELISEQPVFGYGLAQFSNLWPLFAERDTAAGFAPSFYFLSYRNVHNMVLEALLAWGLLGGLVLAGLLLRLWGKAVLRVWGNAQALPAFIGLNTLLAHGLLSGSYFFAHSLFYMAIFAGICLAQKPAQTAQMPG